MNEAPEVTTDAAQPEIEEHVIAEHVLTGQAAFDALKQLGYSDAEARATAWPTGEPARSPEHLALDEYYRAQGACSVVEEVVEAWFAKHFHGLGPMLDERLYNLVHAAKEDLKSILGDNAA